MPLKNDKLLREFPHLAALPVEERLRILLPSAALQAMERAPNFMGVTERQGQASGLPLRTLPRRESKEHASRHPDLSLGFMKNFHLLVYSTAKGIDVISLWSWYDAFREAVEVSLGQSVTWYQWDAREGIDVWESLDRPASSSAAKTPKRAVSLQDGKPSDDRPEITRIMKVMGQAQVAPRELKQLNNMSNSGFVPLPTFGESSSSSNAVATPVQQTSDAPPSSKKNLLGNLKAASEKFKQSQTKAESNQPAAPTPLKPAVQPQSSPKPQSQMKVPTTFPNMPPITPPPAPKSMPFSTPIPMPAPREAAPQPSSAIILGAPPPAAAPVPPPPRPVNLKDPPLISHESRVQALNRIVTAKRADQFRDEVQNYLNGYFHSGAILRVDSRSAKGWAGFGYFHDAKRMETFQLSLTDRSALQIACDSHQPYHGFVVQTPLHHLMFQTFGMEFPEHLCIVPCDTQGMPILLLMGTCSTQRANAIDIYQLQEDAQVIGKAYLRLSKESAAA